MFNLLDSKDEGNISFGEVGRHLFFCLFSIMKQISIFKYVEVICQFSCFEKQDLLKYFFYILDPHRTGVIEKNEIKHFITTIWENDLSSNVKEGMEYFDKLDDGDGCYTFPGEQMQRYLTTYGLPLTIAFINRDRGCQYALSEHILSALSTPSPYRP